MKKVYFGLVLVLFFNSSFGQNPVANDTFINTFSDICPQAFIYSLNCSAPNGISSIDLDPQTPGNQYSISVGGLFVTVAGGNTVNITAFIPGQFQFMYTCTDLSGNTSNAATVTVTVQGNISVYLANISNTTCDNPTSGSFNIQFPFSPSTPTYNVNVTKNGIPYSTFSHSTTVGDYIVSGLSNGLYSCVITPTCTNSPIFIVNNSIQIISANPIEGVITANYNDYNSDGIVNPGDTYSCQYSITNTSSSCTIAGINLQACDSYANNLNISGQPITSLAPNATNSTNFTSTRVLTQYDINQGNLLICSRISLADQNFNINSIYKNVPLNIPNGIKLNAFIDSNNNNIQDNYEPDFTNGTFSYQINSGVLHSINTTSGEHYLYETNPANVYNLTYNIIPNNSFCGGQYTLATSSYSNVTVANGSGITTYNFPITVVPCSEVSVNLSSNQPRPGFSHFTTVIYKNEGNQNDVNGTITYTKNITESVLNLPSGAVATATGFTYNYYYLQPGQTRYITVETQVPTIPTVSLGQLLTNSVTITPTDANMPNNSATITQAIVGSYDPNDKTENHGGKILHSSFTANDYLNYTIRFENTGTAEAINIRVEDVLDSKLDETSIRMVASSNDYILDRVGSNLKWNFNGVNLPPSSPASSTIGHGYIIFQIKPKAGYAVGDIITNIANIYFDFNPAIVTEPCVTEFVSTLATSNFTFKNFSFSPNPVTNVLKITNDSAIDAIEITSILGQKIISKNINDLQTEIDMSQLTNGIYFVKAIANGNEKTVKIVKQ
jgi:uncharacterized repeat protein (TIGR01451 family)